MFLTQIAPLGLKGKSPSQIKHYTKVKQRAVANFIKVISDKPIEDISREEAIRYHKWWQDRVTGKKGRAMSASTARRDLGNMRRLYREYFVRIGEENRDNPFRNLNFKERKIDQKQIPPFAHEWIRDRILVPDVFSNLNRDAALILLVVIETGCRPSELCNITADRIQLGAPVPHIVIDFSPKRAVKTDASVRRIPLIGVSLEAMKRAPKGFPRYRDKETNLSAVLMQIFRKKGMFPTDAHRIYSPRHAFEKRMLEAVLDYGLRCKLMGHSVDRPEYGDGGSLEFRRQELQKIELPFPPDLFTLLDAKPVGKSRTTRRKRVT
ncbi:MAG: integrase [Lentilitoribacter sp.]